MDSQTQMVHGHGHSYEQDPQNVDLHQGGEDEEHHEKKSVLKKVKAKAKKIKDTIKKHGHGHNHDTNEQHIPDDHDLDEEDDDEEEEEDPEAHGAPIYESAATGRRSIPGQVEDSGHTRGKFERSGVTMGDPFGSGNRHESPKESDTFGSSISGQEGTPNITIGIGPPKVNFGNAMVKGEEPHDPQNTTASLTAGVGYDRNKVTDPSRTFVEDTSGQPRISLKRPMELQEDPHAPTSKLEAKTPSNSQTKVAEPVGAGTEEANITPLIQTFDKMNVQDDSEQKAKPDVSLASAQTYNTQYPSSGSHDRFTPGPESIQSNYSQKISSATSAIADKAVNAKNIVASKLGYGQKGVNDRGGGGENNSNISGSAMEYGKKIASTVTEKLSPVYGKVTGAGGAGAVISKLPGAGTNTSTNTKENYESEAGMKGQDKGVSMREYLAEKLRPGEEDKALSEVISDALSNKEETRKKAEKPAMGKVTESEKVKRRLGTGEETSEKAVGESYVNSPGTGVVDKLKGAVSSWFGDSGNLQPSQGNEGMSKSSSEEVGHGSHGVLEEKRLQESSHACVG